MKDLNLPVGLEKSFFAAAGRHGATAGQCRDLGGSEVFARSCVFCHPYGGNAIDPSLPLEDAPELGSYYSFKSLVRQGRGQMPAFFSSEISDSHLQKLYRYVSSAYGG